MNREYGNFAEKIGAFAAPGSKVHIENQTIIVSEQDGRSEGRRDWQSINAGMLNTVITGNYLYKPVQKQQCEKEAFLRERIAQGQGKTKGKEIVLIGEMGVGKTMLSQEITECELEQKLGGRKFDSRKSRKYGQKISGEYRRVSATV